MRLRTTSGQSTPSVVLDLMGKTTDFLSNYLLRLPPQYVIMTYFSSTLAYINGVQVRSVFFTITVNLSMAHGNSEKSVASWSDVVFYGNCAIISY